MFKSIVCTTDLSENANAAMPLAAELARRFGGSVTVLHVLENLPYYAVAEGITFDIEKWMSDVRRNRERELNDAVAAYAAREKIQAKPVLLQGDCAAQIVKYLKESGSDCVVIATHGRTGLSHLVLGSVAEKVVRGAPCPVLTIRPKKA
jgi:universal stress protein A